MPTLKNYASNLTDAQWKIIEPLIARAQPRGRPREVDMRDVVNAILYVDRTGCQWRNIPADFPAWDTVYYHYRYMRKTGIWKKAHDVLREKVRAKSGKEAMPSAAIIASQSVKMAQKGAQRL
jgi:transposase